MLGYIKKNRKTKYSSNSATYPANKQTKNKKWKTCIHSHSLTHCEKIE